MMGGALGLAVLASLAAARTESLLAVGAALPLRSPAATTSPSPSAPSFAAAAALLSGALPRAERQAPAFS